MSVLIVIFNSSIWETDREIEREVLYLRVLSVGLVADKWIIGRKPKYLGREELSQFYFERQKSHID
jgi:hypothetical protein